MDLKGKVLQFLKASNKEVSISEMIKKFKLNYEETLLLLDIIYELELDGKIYCSGNNSYLYVPAEFYPKIGIVKMSNKKKLYIQCGKKVVNFPEDKDNKEKDDDENIKVSEGDIVFVEISKSTEHKMKLVGKVTRIIKKPELTGINTFYKGILKKKYDKNTYYVTIDGVDIIIPDDNLKGAYPGDTVSIQVVDNKYARVVEVVDRSPAMHVLEYKNVNGNLRWTPVDSLNNSFLVSFEEKMPEFKENDHILIQFLDGKPTYVKTIELGNDLKDRIITMLYDAGFPVESSLAAKAEIQEIMSRPLDSEMASRTDLRNLVTISCDPDNAKDLDDAFSVVYEDGVYTLYYSIADASYFVKPGMALFDEAYQRGSTAYIANYAFPMLGEELAQGVCSLNPNGDKLAITFMHKFDTEGNIIDFSIFRSVIRSNYQMAYGKVNKALEEGIVDSEYLPYMDMLVVSKNLSDLLEKRKLERGAVCLNVFEYEFSYDEDGNVSSMDYRHRGPAEKMIENFALVTNATTIATLYYLGVLVMFRNHEGPDADSIAKLKHNAPWINNYMKYCKKISDPSILQKILLSVYGKTSELESMHYAKDILCAFPRAYYSSENKGHFGLAYIVYGTFTSDGRRFADLFNHTGIGALLDGKVEEFAQQFPNIESMCEHITEMEIRIESIDRQVKNMQLKKYLAAYMDQVLEAEIVFINRDFVYVRTKNGLYGIVPIDRSSYRGKMVNIYGQWCGQGDVIKIMLEGVDEVNNGIIFKTVGVKTVALKKERKKKNDKH